VMLPLLPALCASSTVLEGKFTGLLDARMEYYKSNQKTIPSVTGKVIPEQVFSEADYDRCIYQQITKDIARFNGDDILDPVWVNSRGAMARFDRGSIEIRVMDIQECPAADVAIQRFVIESLRLLISEKLSTYEHQKNIETDVLTFVLDETITDGLAIDVEDRGYLSVFGFNEPLSVHDLLQKLLDFIPKQPWTKVIQTILDEGNLSTRIRRSLNGDQSERAIQKTWYRLADCLQKNTMFIP
jgi:carboxylate-amine ligase